MFTSSDSMIVAFQSTDFCEEPSKFNHC